MHLIAETVFVYFYFVKSLYLSFQGIKSDGKTPITGNDPLDTSRIINETFVLAWLNHIDQAIGKGKVTYFELDNEPGLWNNIQRYFYLSSPLSLRSSTPTNFYN